MLHTIKEELETLFVLLGFLSLWWLVFCAVCNLFCVLIDYDFFFTISFTLFFLLWFFYFGFLAFYNILKYNIEENREFLEKQKDILYKMLK
jgi:hypothetical protein